MIRWKFLWPLALFLTLAVTNRYEGPPPDRNYVPGDTYSYLMLAEAAPRLPAGPTFFHHAQRIALPYLIGLVHLTVPLPIHRLFQAAAMAISLLILLLAWDLLDNLGVRRQQAAIALALLALNPWAFRPYLTFPEMVNDLGFVMGVVVMLRGLVRGASATVLMGQMIASLSRQTGLMLVPLVAIWVWHDRRTWGRMETRRRIAFCGAVAAVAGGVYLVTAWLVAGISYESENLEHLLGVAHWVATQFDAPMLGDFLLRASLPALMALTLLVGLGRPARRRAASASGAEPEPTIVVPLLWCATLLIWAQPLLGGPDMTGPTVIRLVAIGLLPLCLIVGIRLRDADAFTGAGRGRVMGILALLAAASLHHRYVLDSTPSANDKVVFAALYLAACGGALALARLEARAPRDGMMGGAPWTGSPPPSTDS